MADGGHSVSRRRSKVSFLNETDPRFSNAPAMRGGAGRESRATDNSGKKRPRISFTGEEFGFGYQATGAFLSEAKRSRTVPDAGFRAAKARTEREWDEASENACFDYDNPITQPLRTKEQALMAVKQNQADFAIVPFYAPYAGYDFESLRAIGNLSTLLGVQQIEATDTFCLAVHESQLYDLIQSAHPGTGFSALQRRFRKSWGPVDSGSGNAPGGATYDAEMPRAGLPIDMADQKLIRDRIDMVFAGPEAARRCKSKLDGLRAIGVEVREMTQTVEPHRELARLARSTVNTVRQTNTMYDPVSGETKFFSTLGAEAQTGKLFGMVLPYEVAMRSSDYIIIDHEYDDSPADKTRFMVVEDNIDHSRVEDALRTTDARTRYWERRLRVVAKGAHNSLMQKSVGKLFMLVGAVATAIGGAKLAGWPGLELLRGGGLDMMALLLGLSLLTVGSLMQLLSSSTDIGVRMMIRFRRDLTAASIADIENFLRNYGVRHHVVRTDEDSELDKPAPIILDIEFAPVDFMHNPWTMLTRRLRGSVVNGAIKKAFTRWKNRGVVVIAAMPIERDEDNKLKFQMPRHEQRRWWAEGFSDFLTFNVEEWSTRWMRILFYYLTPTLLLALIAGVVVAPDYLQTLLGRLIGQR